jgi:hypothetical protein
MKEKHILLSCSLFLIDSKIPGTASMFKFPKLSHLSQYKAKISAAWAEQGMFFAVI